MYQKYKIIIHKCTILAKKFNQCIINKMKVNQVST
jgi:hypothetical protein